MAQANVDPAELRRFASDLKRFNDDMTALLGGLHSRLRGLENTWRDQEQRKFTENFEHSLKSMAGFLEKSQEHVSTVSKKAAAIEAYLKAR